MEETNVELARKRAATVYAILEALKTSSHAEAISALGMAMTLQLVLQSGVPRDVMMAELKEKEEIAIRGLVS